MSRKTVLLKRALRQAARGKGTTHDGRTPLSNGSHGITITPSRVVKGEGTYLMREDNAFAKAPHRLRGEGNVCSRPAGERFQARLRRCLKG